MTKAGTLPKHTYNKPGYSGHVSTQPSDIVDHERIAAETWRAMLRTKSKKSRRLTKRKGWR